MVKQYLVNLRRNWLAAALVVVIVAAAGGYTAWKYLQNRPSNGQPIPLSQVTPASPGTRVEPASSQGGSTMRGASQPISIKLSQGQAQNQAVAFVPLADGEPLSEEEIARLLARLPALPVDPADAQNFKLAVQPIPPPRPGETVLEAFPPPPDDYTNAGSGEPGPLRVLRYSPEGEIPVAPFLSMTFNQPMVALDTLSSLAAAGVPAQIDPPLPGTWRWLGTRTLTFQYESDLIDRLPKATTFTVTIPAGTQSAAGGVLAETVQWTFQTPPPTLTQTYPGSQPQSREPLFFIAFDQRVDPAAVLEHISVRAGGQRASLRLVGEEDVRAEKDAAYLLDSALPGRWLAFRAAEPLPADAEVTVEIGPGTPSAEGPLVTQAAQSYSFRTYGPLRIEEHGCAWGGDRCQPLTPFYIRFNNPIDESAYSDDLVRVEPEIPGAVVNMYGNTIQIQGATRGQTTYTVTVSGAIKDIFGQTLGSPARLTFRVGPAEPALYGSGNYMVTVDPVSTKPVFTVYTINYTSLDVQVYAVQPSDWPAYQNYLRNYQRTDVPVTIPGRKVIDRNQRVEAAGDALTEVDIDLSAVMDGPYGHFIVIVKPGQGLINLDRNRYWQTVQSWVQVTQIGLDAFADHSEMVVWASALKDGAPLADVEIIPQPNGQQFRTGPDGTARFPIPDGANFLVARQGADQALLPRSSYFWGDDPWNKRPVTDMLRWYVFDDRAMYRPGEEVHVKGWMRRVGGKQDGDVGLLGGDVSSVSYQVSDPQGNQITSGNAEPNALGGFDFHFTLPEQVNLGYAQISLTANGSLRNLDSTTYYHGFQIQEFRRPEFEVTARNETSGPYFAGGSATVAVTASYYAGGALPNADVTWQVSSSPSSYAPPNWPDFTFGVWTPWWWFGEAAYGMSRFGPTTPATVETFTGKTDATGQHYLQLDFGAGGEPKPVSVLAEATVMDVNRQAWTGATTLLVHPASLYVGLRSERYFVNQGQPLRIEFIVTDLDGNPVADRPVEVRAARLEWKYSAGQWNEVEADVQVCQAGSQAEPVLCTFETPIGGSYRITATVNDAQGRQNQSQITRWVSGGKQPPARNVEQEQVTLIPDKERYQPGDTAQILVQSPFSPAEGLLTVNRSGIVSTQRFQIADGTATLSIPITEGSLPNLHVQVDVNGAAPRLDDDGNPLASVPARPAFATGQINLPVPPVQRELSVQASLAAAELEPGGETTLTVAVRDAAGQPLEGAELAVVVVDEAVLALSNYQLANPIDSFYAERPLDLYSVYGRASIILSNPLALAQDASASNKIMATQTVSRQSMADGAGAPAMAAQPEAAMEMEGYGGDMQAQQPDLIRVRADFNPLAVFAPSVRTGPDGTAQVSVKVPDNLTRYRVMVVAVEDGRRFGTTESNLTARLPLMVRPSAPRFLNFGDRFELPVVLQNQTAEDMTVEVVVRAANLTLSENSGARVTVPARDRVEVRFAAAAEMAGTARIQFAAVGAGIYADAATVELPVYTPATTEAFATYGVLDQGAVAQPVAAPQGVFPQFGGLEITTSSTALHALTDAVLYLTTYPYDCSEQIASRVLAIAALRDVLTAFEAEGLPSPEAMQASVQRDIETLQKLQNNDGGFPYWRRGEESSPFNTIHVTHALLRARAKGFEVPADMLSRALDYVRQVEQYYPSWYSQETRWTLSAYALNVRAQGGQRDPDKALRLIDEAGLDRLSLDAVGWLWPVLQDAPAAQARLEEIRRLVSNRVVETAGAANFTDRYTEQNYLLLGSDRRTDAILLDALIGDNPQSDLIPKVVNGLLAHRTRGRWGNTQENVFVLLTLDRYFNTYEGQPPDFVARIWLGDAYAGSHSFVGYSTERSQTNVPMAYLVEENPGPAGTQDLILSKEGPGRLYYRLGVRYAPTDLRLPPVDMGFVVQRTYEAVDNPDDVRQDEDGVWHIKAGARVRVRLSMVADNRRYHVALVDPLPAGFEVINPDLAVSGGLPPETSGGDPSARPFWWWWGPWYQHENLRDERVEAFTTLLWDGVYSYTYIARATTPGTFVAPPTKAEEMYSPEVFGRGGSDIVVIE